jgi:hypothetical protein
VIGYGDPQNPFPELKLFSRLQLIAAVISERLQLTSFAQESDKELESIAAMHSLKTDSPACSCGQSCTEIPSAHALTAALEIDRPTSSHGHAQRPRGAYALTAYRSHWLAKNHSFTTKTSSTASLGLVSWTTTQLPVETSTPDTVDLDYHSSMESFSNSYASGQKQSICTKSPGQAPRSCSFYTHTLSKQMPVLSCLQCYR